MHAVHATFRNGRLELMQPVDWPDGTRAEVIPLPQTTSSLPSATGRLATWPPDYFQQTAGALVDEDFERPSQRELPQREDW